MEKKMKDERLQGPMPFNGKRMIYGGFAPLLDERGGASGYAEQLDCPGHRSAERGHFPGRRQIEESNDEEEHDLPVVRP